jgi:uncharacterized phosphosugar-binding protein
MTDLVQAYLSVAINVLKDVTRDSAADIHRAAELVADAIQHERDILVYGSGHSALIARDMAGRAGGLVPPLHVHDIADGDAERLEGVAAIILSHYDLQPGSVIFIVSNSGINAVPIEMAMLCKEQGLTVVAVTSVEHSRRYDSRHRSGQKLYQVADLVVDTRAVPGDAAIELPGTSARSGATSTIAGSAIMQAITVQAAGLLAERGFDPPIYVSANVKGGDEHNREMLDRYWNRLVRHEQSRHQP